MKIREYLRRFRGAGLLCLFVATCLAYSMSEKPLLINKSGFSRAVYDEQGKLLRLTLSTDEKYRLWVPLTEISPLLVQSTLVNEDKHFYTHPGVNPASLLRAAVTTYIGQGRRFGGSTLSMQLARVRFGITSRSVIGKLEQIFRALQLEHYYSKDEILEAYLNLVSYGGNIEGAGAASLIYFGKEPAKLNIAEALTLSVIPQNPRARRPPSVNGSAAKQDVATLQLLEARQRLYERWAENDKAVRETREAASLPMTNGSSRDLPFHAPHYVRRVLQEVPFDDHGRPPARVFTSLNLNLQQTLERTVANYVERRSTAGIRNAAALLVHAPTMEVKAYVGSAQYTNASIQGQVDGIRAKRSPGSTLKPFIYALAMDQGLIHPHSILKDSPLRVASYSPENSDGSFVGPLSAHDALIRSRNIPAILLANQLNNPDLYGFLKDAGVRDMATREHYGLSVALGGVEVTMEDLARMYAALANGGRLRPLRYLRDTPVDPGIGVLTPESAFLVLDILKDNPRPDTRFSQLWSKDTMDVHWKTGTSHSFRDAWSSGVFGPYVLIVWVGNFDGTPNPAFTGKDAAAPLFFESIDAIRNSTQFGTNFFVPLHANVTKVEVCALSGQLPGQHCHHKISTWYIPGKSPIQTCQVHREIEIEENSGYRACPGTLTPVHRKIFEFWPSDLLLLFEQAGMPRQTPPPFDPSCTIVTAAGGHLPPQITSPERKVVYSLRSATLGEDSVPLAAVTDADAALVYWFADQTFLGTSTSGKPFLWKPQPGDFVVRAVDDLGSADSIPVKVQLVD